MSILNSRDLTGGSCRESRRGICKPRLWTLALALMLPAASVEAAETASDTAPSPLPTINLAPGPEYADAVRMFQGIPGIERAANGRLWVTWYGGGTGEDLHNYIMLVTSGDDGKTWSPLKMVIDPDKDGPIRAFDPCLWNDPQGRMWLFWAERGGEGYRRPRLLAINTQQSDQENPTWSKPRLVCDGIMMNKPTVSSSGEWLLPMAFWGMDNSNQVFRSTDQGATFSLLGKANVPNKKDRNCDEPMIVQRTDGSLWLLVRTRYGIGESVSTDQGKTWSDVAPSSIKHTASRFFVRRLKSGNLLLVKHGVIDEQTGRKRLMALLSKDDGKTWSGGLMLDERKGVSYPDGVQSPEGVLYVIYDYNRVAEKQIFLARFTEADILAGKLVSDGAQLRIVVNQATAMRPPKPPAVKKPVPAKR